MTSPATPRKIGSTRSAIFAWSSSVFSSEAVPSSRRACWASKSSRCGPLYTNSTASSPVSWTVPGAKPIATSDPVHAGTLPSNVTTLPATDISRSSEFCQCGRTSPPAAASGKVIVAWSSTTGSCRDASDASLCRASCTTVRSLQVSTTRRTVKPMVGHACRDSDLGGTGGHGDRLALHGDVAQHGQARRHRHVEEATVVVDERHALLDADGTIGTDGGGDVQPLDAALARHRREIAAARRAEPDEHGHPGHPDQGAASPSHAHSITRPCRPPPVRRAAVVTATISSERGPVGLGGGQVVGPRLDDARRPVGPPLDGERELVEELPGQEEPGEALGERARARRGSPAGCRRSRRSAGRSTPARWRSWRAGRPSCRARRRTP